MLYFKLKKILTKKFLVINGDTIFNINLNNIIKKEIKKRFILFSFNKFK